MYTFDLDFRVEITFDLFHELRTHEELGIIRPDIWYKGLS